MRILSNGTFFGRFVQEKRNEDSNGFLGYLPKFGEVSLMKNKKGYTKEKKSGILAATAVAMMTVFTIYVNG